METSTDNQKIFACVPRRHMDAEYHVYDAMIAICKSAANELKEAGKWKEGDPLPPCYAKTTTLANMVNRSKEQVRVQLDKLQESGWIVDLHPEGRQRRRKGDFTSSEYRVLTHAEYLAARPNSCPAPRYNAETGKLIKQGTAGAGLRRLNVHKILEAAGLTATLPDFMADAIADSIEKKKKASTGNPVQAASTGKPVLDKPPAQENLCRPSTGNPVAPGTGNPVATNTGNPVTSLKVQSEKAEPEKNLQPASQAPGTEPGAGKNNGGRAGSDVSPSSSSTKNQNQQLWREFLEQEYLPAEMRCAEPTAEEKQEVLEQLKQVGTENLAMVIDDWKDMQSPPLSTLVYGRWKRWLETGGKEFKQAQGYAETERRNALLKAQAKK